ncbi:hypothetical protein HHUSO_G33644 [Huso huso]|uniref:Uncharacterized protein n=1 Tax=Huso huso TaxID=61971 RepID=A0ABR0Y720_HUSHU
MRSSKNSCLTQKIKDYVKGGNPEASDDEVAVAMKTYWCNLRRKDNEKNIWERRQLEAQRKNKRDVS